MKTVTAIEYGSATGDYLPHYLRNAISALNDVLLSIPEEYRDSAEIDFEPEYSHGEVFQLITISYQRQMTAEELAADTEGMREHWLKQTNDAKDRIAFCERQLTALANLPVAPTPAVAA